MTSDNLAIRVSHISKQYKLGGLQEPYHTFRDAIVNSLKAPLKIFDKDSPVEGFWALKDVSFEVEQGEVVGIIGRNGAGKSTLLKILSRITSPTEGTVEHHGRVGSLLEVGTGFHPELTGRENIYLSGSILGMKRREIDAKLDEIVKFSEIEKFLDTPVKRYSSGMYVRLAFAVAAHMDTEILLVDEVLAVGDAQFQKKCMGKMGDVSKSEGKTILFVSHNLAQMQQLCPRGILLENGSLHMDSDMPTIIQNYLVTVNKQTGRQLTYGDKNLIQIERILVNGREGTSPECPIDHDILISIEYELTRESKSFYPNINLFDIDNNYIFCSHQIQPSHILKGKKYRTTLAIPKNYLQDTVYFFDFTALEDSGAITGIPPFYYKSIGSFSVFETWTGFTAKGLLRVKKPGIVCPLLEYITTEI
jgi:lipopolysaccharide transport system ATP-binding protein